MIQLRLSKRDKRHVRRCSIELVLRDHERALVHYLLSLVDESSFEGIVISRMNARNNFPCLASPSFIGRFLEDKNRNGAADEKSRWGEEGEAMYVVGLMAIAGALTIGSPIQSYLLAMCHYPDWQKRLQDEIASVLGGRCPQWEDRERASRYGLEVEAEPQSTRSD